MKDQEYQQIRRSLESECDKQARLNKANEYNKRKRSEETDSQKQIRLRNDRESKKRKRLIETESEREIRLQNDRESKKQKWAKQVSQPHNEINQQEYLNMFDITINGGIEEQC